MPRLYHHVCQISQNTQKIGTIHTPLGKEGIFFVFNTMQNKNDKIRNVAVIAHIDHGKTTLIDALLKQTHTFRENQEEMGAERIMDSNDQEKERGITITAKNCAVEYEGTKINIIDTPGHADFSGEVERTLGMADGALLIVDAQEGPMPQTRFVLKKAFELGLSIIVVINKIDKKLARVDYVIRKTESLFLELAESDDQLNFPILYAVAREGKVFEELPDSSETSGDIKPLLAKIVEYIPAPSAEQEKSFKMVVTSLDYDSHLGRIVIGKVFQGSLKKGDKLVYANDPTKFFTVEKLFVNKGLDREEVSSVESGDIISLSGAHGAKIGQTLADKSDTKPLPGIHISDPTMKITLGANTSPFAGREGDFVTSRQLEERIAKEMERNLSLKIAKRSDGRFDVLGMGELHLAVFLENLRREGYEMEVGKPEVVEKEIDGVVSEPIEESVIVVNNDFVGAINQEMGKRYADVKNIEQINDSETEFTYHVATRAIIGLRSLLLTLTKGTVIFASKVIGYQPVGKSIPTSRTGVLVASESGVALAYGLRSTQDRGISFIAPGTDVYEGMIVGKNAKSDDLTINVTKGKKLTNMRSTSSDGVIQLAPPTTLSLEQSLDFLEDDELLEITPESLRLRKKELKEEIRVKQKRRERVTAKGGF